ncbi:MAG TPA: exonuclease domain-containing protein [Candidatus Lumbricidophila sp.]|nr:exonuclease domain-containing protein [Candidatus Lumbricidophila sp.]
MSALPWFERMAVFDLETTGIDTDTCRIVTAFVGVIESDGSVSRRREWLVNPGVEIPMAATLIHGVSTAQAREHGVNPVLAAAQIADELRALHAAGLSVVAYNASYDFSVLGAELSRSGLPPLPTDLRVVDPLVIDRTVDRYRRGKRTLVDTAALYGVPLDGAHDAGVDAVAAGRVAQALVARYPELGELSAEALHLRQIGWHVAWAEQYQDWRRQNGEPGFTLSTVWPTRA